MSGAEHVGRTIRDLRRAAGLTQNEVARLAGVARATLANVESGRHNLSMASMAGIASALGVSVDTLVGHVPAPRLPCPVFATETAVRCGWCGLLGSSSRPEDAKRMWRRHLAEEHGYQASDPT